MQCAAYHLLMSCAGVNFNPNLAAHLRQQAARLTDWTELSALAETHGLGPLLYTHLKTAGVPLPPAVKRELQALYLRHRHANQVRAAALVEMLTAYQAAGIQALALKGAALARTIYPEPGLRPMSDLDILVSPADARRAQQILTTLGYDAPLLPADAPLPGKHLSAATRRSEGLTVSVEIHHNLFNTNSPVLLALADLTTPPRPFDLNGLTAYTLPDEEMLWHLCQHLLIVAQPLRLIWLADIVGQAERFAAEIDWERVKRQYPLVLSALSLFHFVTPLSDTLRQAARLNIGPAPSGVGVGLQGWPRASIGQQRVQGKSYGRILADTLWPSAWWLRLYYGLGSARSMVWQRWIGHPWQVLRWAGQLWTQRRKLKEI